MIEKSGKYGGSGRCNTRNNPKKSGIHILYYIEEGNSTLIYPGTDGNIEEIFQNCNQCEEISFINWRFSSKIYQSCSNLGRTYQISN